MATRSTGRVTAAIATVDPRRYVDSVAQASIRQAIEELEEPLNEAAGALLKKGHVDAAVAAIRALELVDMVLTDRHQLDETEIEDDE